ncbi:hypothetical protein ACRAWF_35305 [Streptomyces sp. L7]
MSGIAQADIAIHFRTTEIAWFTLMTLLTGTFFLPFAVKAAAIIGKKRVLLVATAAQLHRRPDRRRRHRLPHPC